MKNYDAIVIGSGIGGLTVASLLSRVLKKKVLILEKHAKFGGFTHSFRKKAKWQWDVGVHYVGDMHPKSLVRKIFNFITLNKLDWQSFPEPFQYYIYPDFKFAVSGSAHQFQADLEQMFPNEKLALSQYFRDLKKASESYLFAQLSDESLLKKLLFNISKTTADLLNLTTKQYFDRHFSDLKLKALLDSQWSDTGLPTGKSPFYVHALIVSHYLRGAYYPKGGASKIAESILDVVKSYGGDAQSFAPVTDIIFDNHQNKAIGCRYLEKKKTPEGVTEIVKEVFAPLVISNAGARITYSKWIPASVGNAGAEMAQEIASVPPGLSSITVYIGFKEHPLKLGVKGENYWIFSQYDHDKMAAESNQILNGIATMALVTFGSMHNSEIQNSTAQIVTLIDPKEFQKWNGTSLQNRGEEYRELKIKIGNTLIDFVDKHIPGFKDLVEFIEVGTPLTVTHYTDQPFGEIYGLSGTAEKYTLLKDLGAETPVENLYLTGADIGMAGLAGALLGGIITFYKLAMRDLLSFRTLQLATEYFLHKYKSGFKLK